MEKLFSSKFTWDFDPYPTPLYGIFSQLVYTYLKKDQNWGSHRGWKFGGLYSHSSPPVIGSHTKQKKLHKSLLCYSSRQNTTVLVTALQQCTFLTDIIEWGHVLRLFVNQYFVWLTSIQGIILINYHESKTTVFFFLVREPITGGVHSLTGLILHDWQSWGRNKHDELQTCPDQDSLDDFLKARMKHNIQRWKLVIIWQ